MVASFDEQMLVTHELNWSWKAEEHMQSGLCPKTDVLVMRKARFGGENGVRITADLVHRLFEAGGISAGRVKPSVVA